MILVEGLSDEAPLGKMSMSQFELTEKGAQAHRDLSSAVAEHRRKALQGLSPEMLQGLNDVMLRIQRNLSAE